MTAEIAILNKYAVALAADSAVTISAGSREEKIFDSADKLFELSNQNHIGIMIYNGMSFAGIPLQNIIKNFRSKNVSYKTVRDAASAFLNHLREIGASAPRDITDAAVKRLLSTMLQQLADACTETLQERIRKSELPDITKPENFTNFLESILADEIKMRQEIFAALPRARFHKPLSTRDTTSFVFPLIEEKISELFPYAGTGAISDILAMSSLALLSSFMSDNFTGIVVAGFGKDELFPTLCCYELDGIIHKSVKYIDKQFVDIDREGRKASVLPFAQKEMVDRFLYGLDDDIEENLVGFCETTVPEMRKTIMSVLTFEDDDDRKAIEEEIIQAEIAFTRNLRDKALEAIRSVSRRAIEDMVEFMPKPELAKMAEALVNLTSIKRRVSRGMETVGGPIDVAIISQSEGFVWVKRKHYFPIELNMRFLERVRAVAEEAKKVDHAQNAQSGGIRPSRAGSQGRNAVRKRVARRPSGGGGDHA